MFAYDPALLAAVKDAPQTVSGVLQVLGTIEGTCADTDGLKWFTWLYRRVTQAAEDRINVGGFADPAWIAELDVRFANLYFAALRAALSGHPAPGCWTCLFENRNQAAIARIQFALSGVNAHINHDLPQAIVTTCQATGVAPEHGGMHYMDYTALNSTLDSLIEAAKVELNVRLPGDTLPGASQLEDIVGAWNVCAARESAWLNAAHLWQLEATPPLALSFVSVLDGFTTVVGKALLARV